MDTNVEWWLIVIGVLFVLIICSILVALIIYVSNKIVKLKKVQEERNYI